MARFQGTLGFLLQLVDRKGWIQQSSRWSSYCSRFLNSGFTVPWCVAMSPVHLKKDTHTHIYIYIWYCSSFWNTSLHVQFQLWSLTACMQPFFVSKRRGALTGGVGEEIGIWRGAQIEKCNPREQPLTCSQRDRLWAQSGANGSS